MQHPTPRARFNFLSFLCLAGLVLAIGVHFGTYFGSSITPSHPLFWGLHVALFPLFFVFVVRLGRWQPRRQAGPGMTQRQLRWRELRVYFPGWTKRTAVLLFAYVAYNFATSIKHLPNGAASTNNLDPEQAVYLVRAFSGHWLLFYTLPALFFLYVPRDASPSDISAETATQEQTKV